MTGAISGGRNPPNTHGGSDIKGLPGDVPERFQSWEKVDSMQTWERESDAIAFAMLPEDIKKESDSKAMGFNVHVDVFLSPEGKMRAYCYNCQSDKCIHSWEAMQGALKSIALKVLEMECGDFINAIKLLKVLPYEEKERVLKYRGIDTEDLNEYMWEILPKNSERIKERYGEGFKDFAFYP